MVERNGRKKSALLRPSQVITLQTISPVSVTRIFSLFSPLPTFLYRFPNDKLRLARFISICGFSFLLPFSYFSFREYKWTKKSKYKYIGKKISFLCFQCFIKNEISFHWISDCLWLKIYKLNVRRFFFNVFWTFQSCDFDLSWN